MGDLFNSIPTTFNVSFYGDTQQINETLSKGRVRIFYKGMNRNHTYISDDFANQLISSLPYAPVKGIFNKEEVDFEDHGKDNTDGKIYGVVMADPNFAWEEHLDEDGITRSYACADVLLFTGLYPEAKLIYGESQSMEIFRETLQGEWRISEEDGQPYYHFLKGSLVGLQVLGKDTEPCFEGASFYSYNKELKELLNYLSFNKKEEQKKMDKSIFRISNSEKFEKLFDLINPNYNEEENWELSEMIFEIYDDYVVSVNRNGEYTRTYYSTNGDEISLGDSVPVKIIDVSETEYAALEAIKATTGSYEKMTENYNNALSENKDLKEKVEENANFQSKINELNQTINEKVSEITTFTEKVNAYENEKIENNKRIEDLTNENKTLTEFKKGIEKEQKTKILDKYEEYLSEEQITKFQEVIDTYSVEDFKKEVCVAAVEATPEIFSRKQSEPTMFFSGTKVDNNDLKDDNDNSPVIRLLNKHKNGGNK